MEIRDIVALIAFACSAGVGIISKNTPLPYWIGLFVLLIILARPWVKKEMRKTKENNLKAKREAYYRSQVEPVVILLTEFHKLIGKQSGYGYSMGVVINRPPLTTDQENLKLYSSLWESGFEEYLTTIIKCAPDFRTPELAIDSMVMAFNSSQRFISSFWAKLTWPAEYKLNRSDDAKEFMYRYNVCGMDFQKYINGINMKTFKDIDGNETRNSFFTDFKHL